MIPLFLYFLFGALVGIIGSRIGAPFWAMVMLAFVIGALFPGDIFLRHRKTIARGI